MGRKIRGNVPPQASAGCPFGKHLHAGASRWRGKCAPACLNVERLHDGLELEKKWKAEIRVLMEFAWWCENPGSRTISERDSLARSGTLRHYAANNDTRSPVDIETFEPLTACQTMEHLRKR